MKFEDYEKGRAALYSEFAEKVRDILEVAIGPSTAAPRPQSLQWRAKDRVSLKPKLAERNLLLKRGCPLNQPASSKSCSRIAGSRSHLDKDAMKRLQNLLAPAFGILTACGGPQSTLRTDTQTVTLDQEAGESGLCHVHYQHVDREAPCTEIAALMRSELRIPARAHLALRPSKTVPYAEVSRLLQSLREAGYNIKIGYISSQ